MNNPSVRTTRTNSHALTNEDYSALEKSYISREIATAAGLYRVNSLDGRDLVGRSGGGDYAGIVFSYSWPGTNGAHLHRLRLDHPPFEADGKPAHKYLTASRERNRLYLPPCEPKLLTDTAMPVVLTEGEKKGLALWHAALESANGNGTPTFLPVAIPGVWGFRGTVGIRQNSKGERTPEKGVISDFDRITWTGRKATILFDANAATNGSVQAARRELARELTRRGAEVWISDLPPTPNVNGIDDFLGLFGLISGLDVIRSATRYEWRKELIVNENDRPLAILANAITALRSAPEWCQVLAFDEFSQRVTTLRNVPWGSVNAWTEQEDRLCADWMQHHGLRIGINDAAAAVETVARDSLYHPVRAFLELLKWDRIPRLDDWLTLYLGAEPSNLTRAFAARWLISAVARIYKPGAKADCCLILEGGQGTYKSTAIRILGEPWFTDDVPDLGSKEAGFATLGNWICELPELDAISRPEMSRVKSFLSRSVDHFRPPYGRRYIDFPRQCIFAGTVNHAEYLRDETGGRRFWPVSVGKINLAALERDRDQLLAEAVDRFLRGENWWLDSTLNEAAVKEQDARYLSDDWEPAIAKWLNANSGDPPHESARVSTAQVLEHAVQKPTKEFQHPRTQFAPAQFCATWGGDRLSGKPGTSVPDSTPRSHRNLEGSSRSSRSRKSCQDSLYIYFLLNLSK